MMELYDNAFSPFARKVRMVLDHKNLAYTVVDGLKKSSATALARINGRVEVPALVDGATTVVNSADIVAYLDHLYPEPPVLPADPAARARARAWERCADTVLDPILVDISYWSWADRPDEMPPGLLDAARRDLATVYDAVDGELADQDYLCGALSIADIALFPHVVSAPSLEVPFSKARHQRLAAWLEGMRGLDICRADVDRVRAYLANLDGAELETERIFWRGDRIEWLLARGYHHWFVGEIEAGRVIWPGLGIPGPRSGQGGSS